MSFFLYLIAIVFFLGGVMGGIKFYDLTNQIAPLVYLAGIGTLLAIFLAVFGRILDWLDDINNAISASNQLLAKLVDQDSDDTKKVTDT